MPNPEKIQEIKPQTAFPPKPKPKKKKSKKKLIIFLIIIIISAGLFYYFKFAQVEKIEYQTTKINKGPLAQTVNETGVVKSPRDLSLNFLESGTIQDILILVGDNVKKGQILARLDDENLRIKERELQANLAASRASLAKLKAGADNVEIAVSQASVQQAKSAYAASKIDLVKTQKTVEENISQAQKSLDDLLDDSARTLTAYEQAVKLKEVNFENTKDNYSNIIQNNKNTSLVNLEAKLVLADTALDNIDRIISDTDLEKTFSVQNSRFIIDTQNAHNQALILLNSANRALEKAKNNSDTDNINKALEDGITALNKASSALNYCYNGLENTIPSAQVSQTAIDAYKTTISSQSTTINTAILALENAKQDLADSILNYNIKTREAEQNLYTAQTNLSDAKISAQNTLVSAKLAGDQQIHTAQAKVSSTFEALKVAEANLSKVKAPANIYDVDLANSQVKQAEAGLALLQNQIEDTNLRAPIDGIITKVNFKEGEQIGPSNTIITLLGTANFEVEVLISETDIAKINKNDKAEITLDALGEAVKFQGIVASIEPAETIISDVIYYKTKINFLDKNKLKKIKHGMTANITITTEKKENVLSALSRAIVEKNGADQDGRKKYLRILKGEEVIEIPIETGLRGDGGYIEILAGDIRENDEVVLYIKN